MGQVGTLHTFSQGTTISSDQMDENFAALKAAINSALFSDATVLITAAQRWKNNTYFVGRNFANTADVNMWKINASNQMETDTDLRVGELAPKTNNSHELGSSSLRWENIWTMLLNVDITASPPASAGATGVKGTVVIDDSHIYVCVATDTWKRVAISTW